MKVQQATEHNTPHELNGAFQYPKVQFSDSSEYSLCDGKAKGWGVLACFDGDSDVDVTAFYFGGLHDRNAEGHGQLHIKSKNVSYVGGWRDNLASGWGKWCDSWSEEWPPLHYRRVDSVQKTVSYEGGFKEGYFHGYGELKWSDESNYKGSWNEGRRYSYGVYTTKDGDQYVWQHETPKVCSCDPKKSGHCICGKTCAVPESVFEKEKKAHEKAEQKYQDEVKRLQEVKNKLRDVEKEKVGLKEKVNEEREKLESEKRLFDEERIENKMLGTEIKVLMFFAIVAALQFVWFNSK